MEYTAEDYISHRLQRSGILVAKPKFDLNGTDLLVFVEMGDGVKFGRIQCKGRSLKKSSTGVNINKDYVSEGFIFFLYLDDGEFEAHNLYCFFSSDIEQWSLNKKGEYTKSIGADFKSKFEFYEFNESKVEMIKNMIRSAQSSGEFKRLVYCQFSGVLPGLFGVMNND